MADIEWSDYKHQPLEMCCNKRAILASSEYRFPFPARADSALEVTVTSWRRSAMFDLEGTCLFTKAWNSVTNYTEKKINMWIIVWK